MVRLAGKCIVGFMTKFQSGDRSKLTEEILKAQIRVLRDLGITDKVMLMNKDLDFLTRDMAKEKDAETNYVIMAVRRILEI